MVTLLNEKKNKIAKDLFSKKYKQRIVKPKKGKEVLKEKNKILILIKSCSNLLNYFR